MAAAALVGAVAERAQQIGLCAPDQTNARPPRNRKPLFQRQPAGKAALAQVSFVAVHGAFSFVTALFQHAYERTVTPPSPRVRGEGRDEGASPLGSDYSAQTR